MVWSSERSTTLPSLLLADNKDWHSATGLALSYPSASRRYTPSTETHECQASFSTTRDAWTPLFLLDHNKTPHPPPDKLTVNTTQEKLQKSTTKITADRRLRPPASTSKRVRAPTSKGVPQASDQTTPHRLNCYHKSIPITTRLHHINNMSPNGILQHSIPIPIASCLQRCIEEGTVQLVQSIDWSCEHVSSWLVQSINIAQSLLFYLISAPDRNLIVQQSYSSLIIIDN